MGFNLEANGPIPEPESLDRSFYDFVIIGGGPAGSTLATLLARGGRSVLMLEAARFPRVTVGEIVAPTALWRVWHALGIDQATLDHLFVRKWRGAWQSDSGQVFRFEQDVHPDDDRCRPFVYNMERSTYDEYLFRLALQSGTVGLQEVGNIEVHKAESGRLNGVSFDWKGGRHQVGCRMVLDASGRVNFLGKALGLRMDFVELKSFSVFAHWLGAARATGDAEGDIRILFGKDMWFWFAPLKERTSIGVVSNKDVHWEEYAQDPEAFYNKYVYTHEYVRSRITDARRVTEIKPIAKSYTTANFKDYHYFCTKLLGDGWAVIGDAAGFIDPIFSAGLFIAQSAAQYLAEELLKLPADVDPTPEQLGEYEARYFREFGDNLNHIRWFATYYFDPRFVDLFLGYGNRDPENRQLYIDTFVAYDPDAILRFGKLMKRFLKLTSAAARRAEGSAEAAQEEAAG